LQIVSENGSQFVSQEYESFLKTNGIQHLKSTPYHPATNGLAQMMVQTFKNAMKTTQNSSSLQKNLDYLFMAYRNSSHATTHRSPAQLFLGGGSLRNPMYLLKPDETRQVISNQTEQTKVRNHVRQFCVGRTVLAITFEPPHTISICRSTSGCSEATNVVIVLRININNIHRAIGKNQRFQIH